jgi:UPF0716 protein FxsA
MGRTQRAGRVSPGFPRHPTALQFARWHCKVFPKGLAVLSRLRTVFILLPVVDIALLIWLGYHTSGLLVLALLLGSALLGAHIARHQKWRTLARVQADLAAGTVPAHSLMDGLIVYVAAVLLIVPGIITDVLALGLLLPPTRRLFKSWLAVQLGRRMDAARFSSGPAAAGCSREPFAHDEIIDARVVDSPATSGGRSA